MKNVQFLSVGCIYKNEHAQIPKTLSKFIRDVNACIYDRFRTKNAQETACSVVHVIGLTNKTWMSKALDKLHYLSSVKIHHVF